jgi:hypothetical protein
VTADVYLNATWNSGTITTNPDTGSTTVRILVAGPSATSNPGGTIVLAAGTHLPLVRFTDSPELLVERGGQIVVA